MGTAQASKGDISFENHAYLLVFFFFLWFLLNFSLSPTSTEKPEELTIFLDYLILTTHKHLEVLVVSCKLVRETFSKLTLLAFRNAVVFISTCIFGVT